MSKTWAVTDNKPTNKRPKSSNKIKPKARVIYFPLVLRSRPAAVDPRSCEGGGVLKIAWPHRWEHDKNPESFFECLTRLKSDGFRFRVAVLGESYEEKPPVFDEFRYANVRTVVLILPSSHKRRVSDCGGGFALLFLKVACSSMASPES